jgi:hypothetical protein
MHYGCVFACIMIVVVVVCCIYSFRLWCGCVISCGLGMRLMAYKYIIISWLYSYAYKNLHKYLCWNVAACIWVYEYIVGCRNVNAGWDQMYTRTYQSGIGMYREIVVCDIVIMFMCVVAWLLSINKNVSVLMGMLYFSVLYSCEILLYVSLCRVVYTSLDRGILDGYGIIMVIDDSALSVCAHGRVEMLSILLLGLMFIYMVA